jgi:hypothetical protein
MSEFKAKFFGRVGATQPVETEQDEWQKFLNNEEFQAYREVVLLCWTG